MPALSLGSAADLRTQRRVNARPAPPKHSGSSLLLEYAGAAWAFAVEALSAELRAGWFYRLSLTGPISNRIFFHPEDTRPHRLEEADAYFRGRFRFAGESVEVTTGSVFDVAAPSPGFAEALHGFEWLRHVDAAGGENARKLALKLTGEWLDRHARYGKPAWQPEIMGLRFINLLAHGRFFLANSDLVWRSRFYVSLRNQARVLARTVPHAPEGLPKLHAAAGLALAGLCLMDMRAASQGLAFLVEEMDKQILPDGGHVTRSPEALLDSFRVLSMVQQALDAAHREVQPHVRSALDRMAPMIRFFRMGDGGLCVFNGGGESDSRQIEELLDRDDAHGKPFAHAPHSGFQRIAAGKSLVLFDVGAPPQGAFATDAHAGCLSFEMNAGIHRLIVNCGSGRHHKEPWVSAVRATAAHSTLTLADTSSAALLPEGWRRRMLGPRLLARDGGTQTRRSETAEGVVVEANHNFYEPMFGVQHERCLTLSPRGLILSGVDQLRPRRRKSGRGPNLAFAIRFHIHPDIRLSLAHGGASVLLKLPNGEGWRFRCDSGGLAIEESIYLGSGALRRTEQLVVSGHVRDEDIAIAWILEQVGAAGG